MQLQLQPQPWYLQLDQELQHSAEMQRWIQLQLVKIVLLPAFTPPALNPAAESIDGAVATAPTQVASTPTTAMVHATSSITPATLPIFSCQTAASPPASNPAAATTPTQTAALPWYLQQDQELQHSIEMQRSAATLQLPQLRSLLLLQPFLLFQIFSLTDTRFGQ